MENEAGRSEWNEQLNFALSFFSCNRRCETAKETGNPLIWWNYLETKMKYAFDINTDPEIDTELMTRRATIQQIIKRVSNYPNMNTPQVQYARNKALTELNDLLFEIDILIDRVVNEKMPFLKVARKESIEEDLV